METNQKNQEPNQGRSGTEDSSLGRSGQAQEVSSNPSKGNAPGKGNDQSRSSGSGRSPEDPGKQSQGTSSGNPGDSGRGSDYRPSSGEPDLKSGSSDRGSTQQPGGKSGREGGMWAQHKSVLQKHIQPTMGTTIQGPKQHVVQHPLPTKMS